MVGLVGCFGLFVCLFVFMSTYPAEQTSAFITANRKAINVGPWLFATVSDSGFARQFFENDHRVPRVAIRRRFSFEGGVFVLTLFGLWLRREGNGIRESSA